MLIMIICLEVYIVSQSLEENLKNEDWLSLIIKF